jgi:hypothetical protein
MMLDIRSGNQFFGPLNLLSLDDFGLSRNDRLLHLVEQCDIQYYLHCKISKPKEKLAVKKSF